MITRILLAVLTLAIFLGAGGYTLVSLNEKSFRLAEVSRDACYARYAIALSGGPTAPEPVMRQCNQPLRDYEAGKLWRYGFAAAAGATAAALIVGGIVILRRAAAAAGVQAIDR